MQPSGRPRITGGVRRAEVDARTRQRETRPQVARPGGPGGSVHAQRPVLAAQEQRQRAQHERSRPSPRPDHAGRARPPRGARRGSHASTTSIATGRPTTHSGRAVQCSSSCRPRKVPRALDHRVAAVVQARATTAAPARRRRAATSAHRPRAAPEAPGVLDDDEPDDHRGRGRVVQIDDLQAGFVDAEQQRRQRHGRPAASARRPARRCAAPAARRRRRAAGSPTASGTPAPAGWPPGAARRRAARALRCARRRWSQACSSVSTITACAVQ